MAQGDAPRARRGDNEPRERDLRRSRLGCAPDPVRPRRTDRPCPRARARRHRGDVPVRGAPGRPRERPDRQPARDASARLLAHAPSLGGGRRHVRIARRGRERTDTPDPVRHHRAAHRRLSRGQPLPPALVGRHGDAVPRRGDRVFGRGLARGRHAPRARGRRAGPGRLAAAAEPGDRRARRDPARHGRDAARPGDHGGAGAHRPRAPRRRRPPRVRDRRPGRDRPPDHAGHARGGQGAAGGDRTDGPGLAHGAAAAARRPPRGRQPRGRPLAPARARTPHGPDRQRPHGGNARSADARRRRDAAAAGRRPDGVPDRAGGTDERAATRSGRVGRRHARLRGGRASTARERRRARTAGGRHERPRAARHAGARNHGRGQAEDRPRRRRRLRRRGRAPLSRPAP